MAYEDRPRSPKPTKSQRKAQSDRDRERSRQQRLSDGAERTSKPALPSAPRLSAEEHRARYQDYIGGKVWQRRRLAYYAKHPRLCRACQGTEKMHLHHMSYANAYEGKEPDGDLIALCEGCHDHVHVLHRTAAGRMTLRAATRLVVERAGGVWNEPRRKPLKPARRRLAPKSAKKAIRATSSRISVRPDDKVPFAVVIAAVKVDRGELKRQGYHKKVPASTVLQWHKKRMPSWIGGIRDQQKYDTMIGWCVRYEHRKALINR